MKLRDFEIHSALHKEIDTGGETCSRFEVGNSIGFVYDVASSFSLPHYFQNCDIFYAAPPWQKGFERFNERAGVAGGASWRRFQDAVIRMIELRGDRSFILFCGAQWKKRCPKATFEVKTNITKVSYATALVYTNKNYDWDKVDYSGSESILNDLAAMPFRRIGDFMCGYGQSGLTFHKAGKEFTISDINSKCIWVARERIIGSD